MKTSIKAVIFDMDGLMIDSEGKQSLAMEQLLREQGVEPVYNSAGIVHVVGIRSIENVQRLRDHHKLDAPVDQLHDRKNKLYRQFLAKGVDPMPGLFELLDDLRAAPVKKALASSSFMTDIQTVLRHLKLEKYFGAVVSGYDIEHGKPAPDIFLEAARRIAVAPEGCVVLEDTTAGVQAAKAGNMKVIGVRSRYSTNQDFSQADLIVKSLEELNWQKLQALFKD